MPIQFEQDQALFREVVGIDEAEALLSWLQKHPRSPVDLAQCTHLHAANLQLLAAAHAPVSAWPNDETLTAWLKTILRFQSQGEGHGKDYSDR